MRPLLIGFPTLLFGVPLLIAETLPRDLPQSVAELNILSAEVSFDFGDLGFDWRQRVSSGDPEDGIWIRLRGGGLPTTTPNLIVRDESGSVLAEIPMEVGEPDKDGFYYQRLGSRELPETRPLQLQVRTNDRRGEIRDAASNLLQFDNELVDYFESTDLFLNSVLFNYGVPGIGGGVYCGNDETVRLFVAGQRRFDGGAGAIQPGDRWHIGSNTKAMTATLIGLLIQYGYDEPGTGAPLDWDSNLSDLFPEWAGQLHPRFSTTTLRHLACHRSGLLMTEQEDAETRDMTAGGKNDNPRAFRREMSLRLMSRQHYLDEEQTMESAPGERWRYGHGNYLILGAVIERLTNTSYETALAAFLLNPMNVLTAGFGMPAVDVSPYQPHGHMRSKLYPYTLTRDNGPLPPIWNPAGGLYLSMEDNLKFLRLHMGEQVGILQLDPATLAELHTPHPRFPDTPAGELDPRYGWGWGIGTDSSGGRRLSHDGSYGWFYARMGVYLGWGFAAVAVCNQGDGPENFMNGLVAVNHTQQHLVQQSITKASGGEITFGTPSEPADSNGFLDSILRDYIEVTFDFPPGVLPTDPVGPIDPFAVSLFHPLQEVDQYLQEVAARQRAPRVLDVSLDRDAGQLVFDVRTEPGYLYNLLKSSSLSGDRRVEQRLIEASGASTQLRVPFSADEASSFYFLQDSMP